MTLDSEAETFTRTIQIGGMRFGETATPSFPDITSPDLSQLLPTFTLKPSVMSLEEAHAQLPFRFVLPSWIPDGFLLEPEIQIILPSQKPSSDTGTFNIASAWMASLHVMWRHSDGRFIGLDICRFGPGTQRVEGTIPTPPDGVVAVQVHEQPAALIMQQHGFDPTDNSVCISDDLTLRWREHAKEYDLRTRTPGVSVDEMLRIANSIAE